MNGENAEERAKRIERDGMVPDGSWNRRVVRHPDGSLCIHEVHYKDGVISAWSENFTEACDPEDGIEGLREYVEATFNQSMDALEQPILERRSLPHGPN